MTNIRYVCLSDMHFGAANSVLTELDNNQTTVDPNATSPMLNALVAALTALIGSNDKGTPKPTLILNGDILELALATDNVAYMAFERFLDLIFPKRGDALFDRVVHYLPGNHDHHLWETARELQYSTLINRREPDESLPIPWHATRLYPDDDPRAVESEVLNRVAARRHSGHDVRFRVSYPNLGLRCTHNDTTVVVHHGHFVESMYMLMSTLRQMILPQPRSPVDVWDLEAENFAWIDFFWSTLGRSGEVGTDVALIYDMLQSDDAIKKLARNLATGVAAKTPRKGWTRSRWLTRVALKLLIQRVALKLANSERSTPGETLSANAQRGLDTFLQGPVVRQLCSEAGPQTPARPERVKFVFGHTHKPFSQSRTVVGLGNTVHVFNSGGWVVDTLVAEPRHGASIVLIDDALEIASVCLYRQETVTADYAVALDASLPAEHGPFHERLETVIDPKAQPWSTISSTAATVVRERQRLLKRIIDNAIAEPPAV